MRQVVNPAVRAIRDSIVGGGGSAPFDTASTNPSAYYDRTVLGSMFQTSVGDAPVITESQPIGRCLDQSHPVGAELIAGFPGSYSEGNANSTVSVDGDVIDIARISTGRASVYWSIPTVIGEHYWITVNLADVAGAMGFLYLAAGYNYDLSGAALHSDGYSDVTPANGVKNLFFTASQTTTYVSIVIDNSGPGGSCTASGLSCKSVPGNHAIQSTAGKRPITAGSPIYADFDGVDDAMTTTFAASLGAGCTVCRSLPGTGASITTGVTLTDTYTDNVDAHFLAIYTAAQWAALDAGQIANITALLNAKAGL